MDKETVLDTCTRMLLRWHGWWWHFNRSHARGNNHRTVPGGLGGGHKIQRPLSTRLLQL